MFLTKGQRTTPSHTGKESSRMLLGKLHIQYIWQHKETPLDVPLNSWSDHYPTVRYSNVWLYKTCLIIYCSKVKKGQNFFIFIPVDTDINQISISFTVALVSDLNCTLYISKKSTFNLHMNLTLLTYIFPSGQSTYVPRSLPLLLILLTLNQLLAKLWLSGFKSGTNWSLTNCEMTYHEFNHQLW